MPDKTEPEFDIFSVLKPSARKRILKQESLSVELQEDIILGIALKFKMGFDLDLMVYNYYIATKAKINRDIVKIALSNLIDKGGILAFGRGRYAHAQFEYVVAAHEKKALEAKNKVKETPISIPEPIQIPIEESKPSRKRKKGE